MDTYHYLIESSAIGHIEYRRHSNIMGFVRFGSFSKLHQRSQKSVPSNLSVESPKIKSFSELSYMWCWLVVTSPWRRQICLNFEKNSLILSSLNNNIKFSPFFFFILPNYRNVSSKLKPRTLLNQVFGCMRCLFDKIWSFLYFKLAKLLGSKTHLNSNAD